MEESGERAFDKTEQWELTFSVSQPEVTSVSSGYLFLDFLYLSLLQVNPVLQLSDSLRVKEKQH